jgi:thiol-disulfide isomerase/thioredoxin
MKLETMRPNPAWDAPSYEESVDTLAALPDSTVFKVWGGDWCKDCRKQLPDFGAALEAAEIPEERIEHYPVEKADDGSKIGPLVEAYGVELIPTVVVEIDGEEVVRYVEQEDRPIAVWLAERLEQHV